MKVLIVTRIRNNDMMGVTSHLFLESIICWGLGNGDFQKEDQEKSSAPIELRERCNCEAKEDITAHFGLILPYLKGVSHLQMSSNLSHSHRHTNSTTNSTQTPRTNTKQSRWAPFCVELKAFAKPVPLGCGGVHKRRLGLPEWLV